MYRDKSTMYDINMLNSSGSNSRCAWDWYNLRIYKTKKNYKKQTFTIIWGDCHIFYSELTE